MAARPRRACIDCGARPADVPVVDTTGEFQGWWCARCERRHRLRRMGWSRRIRRRVRRMLKI